MTPSTPVPSRRSPSDQPSATNPALSNSRKNAQESQNWLTLRGAMQGIILCFLCLFAANLSSAAPVKFDIPAQAGHTALQLFGRQAAVEVLFPAGELRKVQTAEVKGEMEPAAALERLLADTGFAAEQTGPKNFVVKKSQTATAGSVKGTLVGEGGKGVAGVLVAVRETGQSTETDRYGEYVFPKMAAGTYVLVATAPGYQPLHITGVQIFAGRQLTLSKEEMRKAKEGPLALEPFVVTADMVTQLDPYQVTAAKSKPFAQGNMDMPRTINDAQPRYIFDAKTIDQSGAIDVGTFLQQRLTMNTLDEPAANAAPNTGGNTITVNLRGLGTDKTLILVNGRRMPGVNVGSQTDRQPDLNGIPMSAIERIEVLPSSASGIYGGSAIGGVVNLILKRDYTGGEVRLGYDRHFGANDAKRTASFSYGMGLEGGKTHFTVAASWSDSKPFLLKDGADIFRANIATIQSRSPTLIFSATAPWLGSVPNILNSSSVFVPVPTGTPGSIGPFAPGTNFGGGPVTAALPNVLSTPSPLIFDDGTPLGSSSTYVPAGTSGSTSAATLRSSLVANAGQWNLDLPLSAQPPTGLLRPISAPVETRSFRFGVRRQMLSWLELTADFFSNENRTNSIRNQLSSFTVPAAAPTNPFNTNVIIQAPNSSVLPFTTRSRTSSVSLGLLATLPANWIGNLDYTRSENSYRYQQFFTNDTSAITADLLSGVLNPFVDTLQFPLNLEKYLAPNTFNGSNEQQTFMLRTSGPLPSLPWGQPHLTVGLEHRVTHTPEKTLTVVMPITTANSTRQVFFARDAKADSAYAEAMVPLVKTGWLPGVHALEAQVAGRREQLEQDTGTFSATTFNLTPPVTQYQGGTVGGQPYFSKADYTSSNFTVGLKYQPLKELTLRASRATAFLPPSPDQLLGNPVPTLNQSVSDPNFPGTTTTGVTVVTGGNPDLTPQNSRSLNLGLIWEPTMSWLRGWRFNAERYKIQQYNAISSLTAQQIVSQEATFPGRVTRDATGRITQVNASMVNLFYRETEGWDLSANYDVATSKGRFTFSAVQSIIVHLKEQYSQTLPAVEEAGYSAGEGGAPKYKSNASLSWEWRQFTVGWTTRHIGSYKVFAAASGPLSVRNSNGAAFDARYTVAAGGDTIPSQTYHDLFLAYRFDHAGSGVGARLLKGLSVQLNVRNVFDKVAPLDPNYTYYLSPYGGGLTGQASYALSVRKAF